MKKTVYIEGTGCNRRQLDLTKIKTYLTLNGYILVEKPEKADYIVLGTCAFKKKEEDISVSRLRNLARYKTKKLLVFGCLPDIAGERYKEFDHLPKIAPKEIENIEGFFHDIDLPFSRVPEAHTIGSSAVSLSKIRSKVQTGEIFSREFLAQFRTTGSKRMNRLLDGVKEYYLFICRGCAGKCSYCAISRSIGQVKSKSPETVLAEFRAGVQEGFRDFIILGDDPGCYGLDSGRTFPDIFEPLLEEGRRHSARSNRHRIHFHIKEIHPKFMLRYGDRLSALMGSNNVKGVLCPIQSGSDRILGLMQREHKANDLVGLISRVKKRNPTGHLSTQIIVGFPSETEDEFAQTLSAVKKGAFDSVVVFPYHDKEGTASSRLEPKIDDRVIKQRMREAFKYFRKEGIRAYYNCP